MVWQYVVLVVKTRVRVRGSATFASVACLGAAFSLELGYPVKH